MSCYDVNQLEVGLHSLQLSATSSTSVHNFTHSSMNVDIQLMPQSMVAKQDNQNAAALSAEEGITKLLSRTKYLIAQENGQRRYGPPPDWKGETPLRGCEVFVGKIPRDCFEDELIPIFERIGPIYMFRLMMEFNGTNRGYGFCVYTNREDTKRAIDELNNYEIRKGKMIGVCLSVDNCRLFVGGIPKNKTREEIFIEMLKVTEGVKDVISYPSVADKTKNRGFAFVEYESHKSAAMARRKLMPGRIQLWGQQIAVDWAEPEREVNEDIMSKVKILYVRNLMLSTTEEQLREYFINLAGGDDQKIERVKKISDYAFVHFQDRDIALMCMEKLNGTQIDGSTIEVTWAKPADKGDPTKTQVARSGKQFMDWNLSTDFTNTSNIFLDPTATLLPGNNSGTSFLWPFDNGVSQLVVPGSGNGTSRTGRRNAAGGRSAAAQRERKHPVEKLQQHQSNPLVYWEALDDICKSYGLELPIYTALPVDIIDITTGGKVQLFAGQVTVPSMRMQCITPRYYSTMEEAKVGAAETAIHNLQYSQMQAAISELNGSYASQVPSSRCNSSSLLPMVLPQGMQQRNMTFPSMSCPSGLYQSTAGSMAGGFSPLIPLSTDENGVPINPMPNIQLPNQLFDYPSHLISNQLATSNLLSCGGLISAGTLIMDPNNINTPSSIIGGANQNTTSCAGPILGHPSSLGDYMPKPSVQNNAINSVIQFNSQSNLGNLLPMLQPITSIQAPVSVAGPANYRLQLSTCVPSAIGQSTLMPVHSSLNSLTTISASNNLISSLNNTSPLSQA